MSTRSDGYEALSVGTSAVSPTDQIAASTNFALIRVEGHPVRFRSDGTLPTAAVGFLLKVDDVLEWEQNPSGLSFISQDGSTATVHVVNLTR